MRKPLSLFLSFVMMLGLFMGSIAPIAHAEGPTKVVLRGSAEALDWGTDKNPLTLDPADGMWKSNPIPLVGGKTIEYKYVIDDQWMSGANLIFTPPFKGNYIFVYYPQAEHTVDVRRVAGEGKATLHVTLPASTPAWATPTLGASLNGFNYAVAPLTKTSGNTWTLELSGTPGESFSYFYSLGDARYAEAKTAARTATFSKENPPIIDDTVSEWKAIPVAKNVNHNFRYTPFVPSHQDNVTVTATVEHFGNVNTGGIYYTTDGTEPMGQRGKATNGAYIPLQATASTESDGIVTTTFAGVIPKQKDSTPVKYRVDVWDTTSTTGTSQFADSNGQAPAEATEFAYYVDTFQSPQWAKDAVIYHVFVDRFYNGDTSNDQPIPPTADYAEQLKGWMGGDIAGVTQKLDYIKELGASTLWISPVFKGPYYHGYHATDFKAIDARFGSKQELETLLAEAHKRGIKVVYDLVPNHSSNQHPFFQDAYKNGTTSPYYNWYSFLEWPNKYKTFYDVAELPQLNNDNYEARAYMLEEVVPYWLTELDFDGFRLDYAKGPSYSFWVDFRHKVKSLKPDAFIFGEIWDTPAKMNSYTGKLDGALDFAMQDTMVNVFAYNAPMTRVSEMVKTNQSLYHPGYSMVSFLDNHDMSRFLFQVGGDTNKLKMAALMQFTVPGVPAIYYGTEVGHTQSRDQREVPDYQDRYYREPMPWDQAKQDQDVLAFYKKVISLHNQEAALRTGTYRELHADESTIVYERQKDDKHFLIVVNKGKETPISMNQLWKNAKLNVELVNALNQADVGKSVDGQLTLTSKAASAAIYEVKGSDGNLSKPVKLLVDQKKVKLAPNASAQVKVTAVYADGSQEDVTALAEWSSTKTHVAAASNGLVTAKDKGKAVIKATYGKKLTVLYVYVE